MALSFALTNGLVFALSRSRAMQFGLHELIGALFLVSAIWSVRRDGDATRRYGIRLGGIFPGAEGDDRSLVRAVWEGIPGALRETAIAIAVAAVVLPVYAFFWPMFNRVPAARHFALDGEHARQIATHLFAIALTEEMYFRGFVQTRLGDAFGVVVTAPVVGAPRESLRAIADRTLGNPRLLAAIALASLLFAITHVTVEVTLARAVVFFPGLLFGVVRAWRGGIGAAVMVHAISNVFEQWLEGR